MSELPSLNPPDPSQHLREIDAFRKTCHLCGLPVGRSPIEQVIRKETLRFCCPGCQQVFILLFNSPEGVPTNFRETNLYRTCLESGIISQREEPPSFKANRTGSQDNKSPVASLDLTLKIEGMWCPACSWLVEEVLRQTKGILEPRVSFLSDLAQVKYFPHLLTPQEIVSKISSLGYSASHFQEVESPSGEKGLLVRLGISAILTANIMMISFALYFGFFQEFSREVIGYLSYPIWLMATPVIFYGGFPILRKAFAGLRYGYTSMETLISVGALAAYLYSFFQMIKGSLHLYFDTASMFITIVLLGKYIESNARRKVSRGIVDLYRLIQQKVRLSTPNSPSLLKSEGIGETKERWVSADAVHPGDEFFVCAGETIPLDGQILSGRGDVDESILTGEPRPIRKTPGDTVMGGVLLLNGKLRLRTTRVGRESSLGQMITLMQKALSQKNPAELLADRITRWFIPVILMLAAMTGVYLRIQKFPMDEVLLRSLTVLVISCPCALGIATPIVKVAAMSLARPRGILIRDLGALERIQTLDTLVFDKTGTLTEGNFSLQEIITAASPPHEALLRAASVEMHSDHYLAKEIVRQAREKSLRIEEAKSYEAFEGMGSKGSVEGKEVLIGSRRFMAHWNLEIPAPWEQKAQSLESQGKTIVFFGWEEIIQGFFVFGDSLKRGIREMIRKLYSRGITTWLVSGDSQQTTRAVAEEAGVPNFLGQTLPSNKVDLIKSLQQKGHRVGMVGDGVNDAAGLAQADVGFALGTGINILQEASDLSFLTADPSRVLEAIDLSALATKTMRQNLFFAFLYNSIGIPLAVAGWLNPLIGVLAMFASSLTVTGNALRLSRRRNL